MQLPSRLCETLPPEGWYDDSERPGHKRWWDGTAWGMRDDEHLFGLNARRFGANLTSEHL